jgi:hypothetical protein
LKPLLQSDDTKHIVATFPVNIRYPSKDIEKLELMNNLAGVNFELPLIDDIKDVVKVKRSIDRSFNPISVQASNTLTKILSFLPFFMYNILFKSINKNNEIIISNVSGSRSRFLFGNSEVEHISAFGPFVPPCSIIAVCHTYAGELTVHVTADNNLPFTSK